MSVIPKYGVHEEINVNSEFDIMAEEIRLLGFTTLDAGFSEQEVDVFSAKFDQAKQRYNETYDSKEGDLKALNENDIIRALPVQDSSFWSIVFNQRLHDLVGRLLGGYYILNQANGLINRKNNSEYHQALYHRDLPYQHFTSSRPLALNALFAMDDFTLENGATRVIPASHHREAFPPEAVVKKFETTVTVKRGTFIVLDCMVYHAGSTNTSSNDRRAINHVFTIPMLRQQLHFPSLIGSAENFTQDQKRILGYGLEEFTSLDAWFGNRKSR